MSLIAQVAEKHPENYGSIVKGIKDLADQTSFIDSASFDYKDIAPVNLDHIHKKYYKDYAAIYKQEHSKERDDKLRAVNAKKEAEINALVDHDLTNNPNRFTKWISIGARGAKSDARQIKYAIGNVSDLDGTVIPIMVDRSLSQGLTPAQFAITAAGARSGIVKSFTSVQKPGALAKELLNVSSDHIITIHDCGTHHGLVSSIDDRSILTRCLLNDVGQYHRNDIITTYIRDMLKRQNITSVAVRSPNYCEARHGTCQMCIGADSSGHLYTIGHTIGIEAASSGSEPLTQMVLDEKHTGGVVGSKSPFEMAEQLYHVPENFTGGAMLAKTSGKITSIKNTPDGGRMIHIGEHEHYVRPNQGINVAVGDKVDSGHVLTDGLVNPLEVLQHTKDMPSSQIALAHQLHSIYDTAGVSGHKKMFEVIAKSVMNAGRVDDPGDHFEDHMSGDLVRWSDVKNKTKLNLVSMNPQEAVGWRLAENYPSMGFSKGQIVIEGMARLFASNRIVSINVYKDPMAVTPTMIGTARGALLKPDWMSHLAYARYGKQKIVEDLAQASKANIHGHDILPAWIYGAEMTMGPGGTF